MRDSRPTALLGYPRGDRIDQEPRCQTAAHRAPNERIDTLPRTRASQEPMGAPPRQENLGDHLGSMRCSSGLRFQLFCVETFSSLPKCQSDGRDLACQRQTSHLRLQPLGQQSRVEIVERSPTTAGPGGRTLEDLFHLMVVVPIETTELLGFLGALQLSTDKAELRTVVRLNPQATIGPQLSLAAEPVRGLHQCDQAGGSHRTDAGNLAQQFHRLMFPALGQKLGSQVSPQGLQSVQLLIEQLCAAAHPGLRDLAQPFLPIARGIDLGAGTGNAPASIQCLKPIHHAGQIFADGLITARQLAQRSESIFSVVDRSQHAGAQQLGQLARIHLVALLPSFNKAFRRGLQTRTSCTCGCSRSYSHAAQVPSSQVTCNSPCRPRINCRILLALVSTMDSITNLPLPFRTAMTIASLCTSMPIYLMSRLIAVASLGERSFVSTSIFPSR